MRYSGIARAFVRLSASGGERSAQAEPPRTICMQGPLTPRPPSCLTAGAARKEVPLGIWPDASSSVSHSFWRQPVWRRYIRTGHLETFEKSSRPTCSKRRPLWPGSLLLQWQRKSRHSSRLLALVSQPASQPAGQPAGQAERARKPISCSASSHSANCPAGARSSNDATTQLARRRDDFDGKQKASTRQRKQK